MTEHSEQLEGVLYFDSAPFEGIGDAELEPVHPDDMPQVVKSTEELPKLTLTFTPEQAEAIAEAIKETIDKAAKALQWVFEAAKKAAKFIEAELYYANDNPRWWHLYKNAKKARTRKKYRRLLMNQLLSKLKAADLRRR